MLVHGFLKLLAIFISWLLSAYEQLLSLLPADTLDFCRNMHTIITKQP